MKRVFTGALAAACCAGVVTAGPSFAASDATECTGTLNGTYGRVIVPDGETCVLDGATTGSVTVGTGSSLFALGATINGKLQSQGAVKVHIYDTTLNKTVMVSGSTGSTIIGNKGCQVDPLAARHIILMNNTGNVAVCDMTIAGKLEVSGNTARVGLYRNMVGSQLMLYNNTGVANRVRDNVVDKHLACYGNTGKVLASGNSADALMGQCTA